VKASQLFAIGAVALSVSFVAAGTPAPSPAFVHKTITSSDEERAPVPCLVGTERCSAKNDPPRICTLDAKNRESCSTEGLKVIEADSR
jgi:hypothetical protein